MADVDIELGGLNHCDGSAFWDERMAARNDDDGTRLSVLAGVFGPMAVQVRREERLDSACVQVTIEPAQGVGSPKLREFEQVIGSIVQHGAILGALHPRTAVHICIELVCDGRNDGSAAAGQSGHNYLAVGANAVQSDLLLASAINAACQALLDAGVAMRSLFVASVLALRADGALVTPQRKHFERRPPSPAAAIKAVFLAVFDSTLEKVIYTHATGDFSVAQYLDAVDKNKQLAASLLHLIRANLASSVSGSPALK